MAELETKIKVPLEADTSSADKKIDKFKHDISKKGVDVPIKVDLKEVTKSLEALNTTVGAIRDTFKKIGKSDKEFKFVNLQKELDNISNKISSITKETKDGLSYINVKPVGLKEMKENISLITENIKELNSAKLNMDSFKDLASTLGRIETLINSIVKGMDFDKLRPVSQIKKDIDETTISLNKLAKSEQKIADIEKTLNNRNRQKIGKTILGNSELDGLENVDTSSLENLIKILKEYVRLGGNLSDIKIPVLNMKTQVKEIKSFADVLEILQKANKIDLIDSSTISNDVKTITTLRQNLNDLNQELDKAQARDRNLNVSFDTKSIEKFTASITEALQAVGSFKLNIPEDFEFDGLSTENLEKIIGKLEEIVGTIKDIGTLLSTGVDTSNLHVKELEVDIKPNVNRIEFLKTIEEQLKDGTVTVNVDLNLSNQNSKDEFELINNDIITKATDNIQDKFREISTNFGDDLDNVITDFQGTLQNEINYDNLFSSLRDSLLEIVEQFQKSINNVSFSKEQTNEIHNLLKQWNDASSMLLRAGNKDAERAALLHQKKGTVSNSYLYDKESSFSGQLLNELARTESGITRKLNEIYDTWLHSHPLEKIKLDKKAIGSNIGFSIEDFEIYRKKYFDQGISNMMVANNGKYTNINWDGISKELLEQVIKQFKKSNIFKNGVLVADSAVQKDGSYNFDIQSELLNNGIIQAMTEVGIKDAESRITIGKIDDLNIDLSELRKEEQKAVDEAQKLHDVLERIATTLSELSGKEFTFGISENVFNGVIDKLEELKQVLKTVDNVVDNVDSSLNIATKTIPNGDTLSGLGVHGSKFKWKTEGFDFSKAKAAQLGTGMYLTDDIENVVNFGSNELKKIELDLKKCFILTNDYISNVADIYKAMGKEGSFDDKTPKQVISDIRKFNKESKENSELFRQNMLNMGYQGMYASDYLANAKIKSEIVVYDEKALSGLLSTTKEDLANLKNTIGTNEFKITLAPDNIEVENIASVETQPIVNPQEFTSQLENELKEFGEKAKIDVIPDIISSEFISEIENEIKESGEKVKVGVVPNVNAAEFITSVKSQFDNVDTAIEIDVKPSEESLNTKINAFERERDIVSSVIKSEISNLSELDKKLANIISSVDNKTNAFRQEEQVVSDVVQSEISDIAALSGWVDSLINDIQRLSSSVSTIPNIELHLDKIDDNEKSKVLEQLMELKKALDGFDYKNLSNLFKEINSLKVKETLPETVQKLSNAILNLKISLNDVSTSSFDFLASIKELSSQGESLSNLVRIMNASQNEIKKAQETAKQQQNAENPQIRKDVDLTYQKGTQEWQDAYNLLDKFGIKLEKIASLSRSIRQDKDGNFLESYKVTYKDGSSRTLGMQNGIVAQRDAIADADKTVKKYSSTLDKLAKLEIKIFDRDADAVDILDFERERKNLSELENELKRLHDLGIVSQDTFEYLTKQRKDAVQDKIKEHQNSIIDKAWEENKNFDDKKALIEATQQAIQWQEEEEEYRKKRQEYLLEGKKQEEEYYMETLSSAYANADKSLAEEKEYIKERNRLIAEGKKQAQEEIKFQKEITRENAKFDKEKDNEREKTFSKFERDQIKASSEAQKELDSIVDEYIKNRNKVEFAKTKAEKDFYDNESTTLFDKIEEKSKSLKDSMLLTESQVKESLDRLDKLEDKLTKKLRLKNAVDTEKESKKLAEQMALGRERAEVKASQRMQNDAKKDELAQAKAINKALEDEYKEKEKEDRKLAEQMASGREKAREKANEEMIKSQLQIAQNQSAANQRKLISAYFLNETNSPYGKLIENSVKVENGVAYVEFIKDMGDYAEITKIKIVKLDEAIEAMNHDAFLPNSPLIKSLGISTQAQKREKTVSPDVLFEINKTNLKWDVAKQSKNSLISSDSAVVKTVEKNIEKIKTELKNGEIDIKEYNNRIEKEIHSFLSIQSIASDKNDALKEMKDYLPDDAKISDPKYGKDEKSFSLSSTYFDDVKKVYVTVEQVYDDVYKTIKVTESTSEVSFDNIISDFQKFEKHLLSTQKKSFTSEASVVELNKLNQELEQTIIFVEKLHSLGIITDEQFKEFNVLKNAYKTDYDTAKKEHDDKIAKSIATKLEKQNKDNTRLLQQYFETKKKSQSSTTISNSLLDILGFGSVSSIDVNDNSAVLTFIKYLDDGIEETTIHVHNLKDMLEELQNNTFSTSSTTTTFNTPHKTLYAEEIKKAIQDANNLFISKKNNLPDGNSFYVNSIKTNIDKLNQELANGKITIDAHRKKLQEELIKLNNIWGYAAGDDDAIEKMKQFANIQSGGTAKLLRVDNKEKTITIVSQFTDANKKLQTLTQTYIKADGVIKGTVKSTKSAATGIVKFLNEMGNKWKEVLKYFLSFGSIYEVWNLLRQGISVVTELNTALTEMRKASDETVASLKRFQAQSFDLANDVGTTAAQIQNSTAEFLRLGESMKDATDSAKAANILFNVSEFESIDEATDALIAMSAAYSELDKMEINDKLNLIGNSYSISTDGLATALQTSASALKTAGVDLDKAIALITAGNAVVRDPSQVGAGLRTISLRIVGTEEAKDQLESFGDDVSDFVVQTTSKSQDTIKNFTKVASNNFQGFDILDDNGNYKDTYEILLGISKIYKEIQETDKKNGSNMTSGLVEALAGKNRANIAASILQNPELLESVYKSSANDSEGSAQEELEKQLDSVEGKLNALHNQAQEFWFTLIDQELLKDGINLLTKLLEVLTAMAEHPIWSLTGIGAGVYGAFKGLSNLG